MQRKIFFFLLIFSLLMVTAVFIPVKSLALPAGVFFSEDFESYSLGDAQAPWSNTSEYKDYSKVTIANDPVISSPTRGKALKLNTLSREILPSPNITTSVTLSTKINNLPPVFCLEYDYYIENSKDIALQLFSTENQWPYAVGIMSQAMGTVSPTVVAGSPTDYSRTAFIGSWHRIIVETDVTNQRYRFSLDYGRNSDWIGFRPGTNLHQTLNTLAFATGNNVDTGIAYIDNIIVYSPTQYSYSMPALDKPYQTFYHEDFQSGELSRFLGNVYLASEEKNYFLRYTQSSQAAAEGYINLFEASRPSFYNASKVMFTADFRLNSLTPQGAGVTLTLAKGASASNDDMSVAITPGELKYLQNGNYISIPSSPVSYSTWHNLKIVYSPFKYTYEIYLNNVLKQTVSAWTASSAAGEVTYVKVNNFTLGASGTRSIDFDNIGFLDLSAYSASAFGPLVTPFPAGNNTPTDTLLNGYVIPEASVNLSPPSITLRWRKSTNTLTTGYKIERKLFSETAYTTIANNISAALNEYTDTTASVNTKYDYKITRLGSSGYGVISTGIDLAPVENRGTVVLLIDNSVKDEISGELNTLRADLTGEGFKYADLFVNRTDTPDAIRNGIKALYTANSDINTVFIIGHVPIKYYGYLSPDGHPKRSFPCDQFYGDMTSSNVWLGDSACISANTYLIPGNIQLAVGRVDFFNMPSFAAKEGQNLSEIDLLKRYFTKDHAFRTGAISVPNAWLFDDRLFSYDVALRNFPQITGGINSMYYNKAITTSSSPTGTVFQWYAGNTGFLWGLKLGYGSDLSCGTMDSTTALYTQSRQKKVMFIGMYGSYFCEWQKKDNLMRAALTGADYGLGAFWINDTNMNLLPLSYDNTLGSSVLNWQNATKYIQAQLMGDPTLTMTHTKSVTGLSARKSGNNNVLSWNASNGADGYYVYRADNASSPFTLISGAAFTDTSFTDTSAPASPVYMVRAVKKHTTASGTKNILSTGAIISTITSSDFEIASVERSALTTPLNITAAIKNNLLNDKSCSVILAVYKEGTDGDKLEKITYKSVSFLAGQQKDVDLSINIPTSAGRYIKIFVWDNVPGNPLSETYKYAY